MCHLGKQLHLCGGLDLLIHVVNHAGQNQQNAGRTDGRQRFVPAPHLNTHALQSGKMSCNH